LELSPLGAEYKVKGSLFCGFADCILQASLVIIRLGSVSVMDDGDNLELSAKQLGVADAGIIESRWGQERRTIDQYLSR
jgi:hypothetical protein